MVRYELCVMQETHCVTSLVRGLENKPGAKSQKHDDNDFADGD